MSLRVEMQPSVGTQSWKLGLDSDLISASSWPGARDHGGVFTSLCFFIFVSQWVRNGVQCREVPSGCDCDPRQQCEGGTWESSAGWTWPSSRPHMCFRGKGDRRHRHRDLEKTRNDSRTVGLTHCLTHFRAQARDELSIQELLLTCLFPSVPLCGEGPGQRPLPSETVEMGEEADRDIKKLKIPFLSPPVMVPIGMRSL